MEMESVEGEEFTISSESKRAKLDLGNDGDADGDKNGSEQVVGLTINGNNGEDKVGENVNNGDDGDNNGNDKQEEHDDGEGEGDKTDEATATLTGSSKSVVEVEGNAWFVVGGNEEGKEGNGSKLEEKRKVWESSSADSTEDDSLKIFQQPFKHGELRDFVKNQEFIQEFLKLFEQLDFQDKVSDLFQFKQSFDLNSIVDPCVYSISQYLTDKVLPFMKKLTGLPLNQTIDMFLSIYKQTDYLLCHDDELDSRRIAFIWYLSEDWKEEDGGTLDLFSATDSLHPEKVVKKIIPEFNKFVFFEVGATSFHQVSEVLKSGKNRLALSGWFYGDPLPRPTIQFPSYISPYPVQESFKDFKDILKKFCHEDYLNPDIFKELNDALCEESQLLIPSFLLPEVYKSICESIVEIDVANPDFFKRRGPVNLVNFEEALPGPSNNVPKEDEDSTTSSNKINVDTLRDLFHSREFLQFLENVTEFPFTTLETTKVTSSLHKYAHGSYTLLKGGAKQTGLPGNREGEGKPDEDEEEEEPNFVDVLFYFAHKWEDDEWGGEEVFCVTEGDEGQQQLMSISPEGNALALAVRTTNVSSFTKYVNCLAKDQVFFVYKMTFAFDGRFE